MEAKKLETITLAEFNQRLDASSAWQTQELERKDAELTRAEQLLSYYEATLDAMEAELNSV